MCIKKSLSNLGNVLNKNIYKVDTTNLFLLFILSTITIYPLLFGGFTTHDDAYMAINEWNGITWKIAKLQSVGQGRLVFLWGFPLSAVPYIIDNRAWYLAIKFGSVFLLLTALCYVILRLFRSSWVALASLAFFFTLIQNGWEHNALTSYPFVFNFYATSFLVSLGLFAKAIDQKKIILAGFAGSLYFFALGSELFVLFFPFYVAVLFSRSAAGEPITRRLNYLLAITLPLAAYLAIYLA